MTVMIVMQGRNQQSRGMQSCDEDSYGNPSGSKVWGERIVQCINNDDCDDIDGENNSYVVCRQ